jgi:hypothetical protein
MTERYSVTLSNTHWERLETNAANAAWVEARQMGLTVEQCDRIALAAVRATRELVEEWAQQQAAPARPVSGEETST